MHHHCTTTHEREQKAEPHLEEGTDNGKGPDGKHSENHTGLYTDCRFTEGIAIEVLGSKQKE